MASWAAVLVREKMRREEPPVAYAIMSKSFVAQIEPMQPEIDESLGISRKEVEEPEVVIL